MTSQTLLALISPENICTFTCACDACHYASHSSAYLHPEQILLLPLTAPKPSKTHPQPGTQTHTFFFVSWLKNLRRAQVPMTLCFAILYVKLGLFKSLKLYMNNRNAWLIQNLLLYTLEITTDFY